MRGRQILFLHGHMGVQEGMADIYGGFFGRDYDVLHPNLPGFGGEPDVGFNDGVLAGYVEWLAGYLRMYGRKPVAVAHSFSAVIAAACAQKHPELFAKEMIFLAPIVKNNKSWQWFANVNKTASLLPERAGRWVLANELKTRVSTRYVVKKKELYPRCLALGRVHNKQFTSVRGALRSYDIINRENIMKYFPENKKVLVVMGAKDNIVKLRDVEGELRGRADLEVLLSAGHVLNYEEPEKIVGLIKKYLGG